MGQTRSHSSRPSEGTQTSGPSSYLRIWKMQRFNRATLFQGFGLREMLWRLWWMPVSA